MYAVTTFFVERFQVLENLYEIIICIQIFDSVETFILQSYKNKDSLNKYNRHIWYINAPICIMGAMKVNKCVLNKKKTFHRRMYVNACNINKQKRTFTHHILFMKCMCMTSCVMILCYVCIYSERHKWVNTHYNVNFFIIKNILVVRQ